MSDPNNPPPPPGQRGGQDPDYGQSDHGPQASYGSQANYGPQPGYGPPPGYGQQPGYQPQPTANGDYPGKTLGIVGLVLSFFTAIIGLIVSIVALRQSKKAGFKNTPALIGVIIGIVSTVLALVFGGIAIAGAIALLNQCAELGPGVHNVNGVTVTCGG